ncbi:MAG: hypothetical protein JWQ98_1940 [Chlorobi bacterium]|nr:hypothetical protein [Chlorobiota bacterium]
MKPFTFVLAQVAHRSELLVWMEPFIIGLAVGMLLMFAIRKLYHRF